MKTLILISTALLLSLTAFTQQQEENLKTELNLTELEAPAISELDLSNEEIISSNVQATDNKKTNTRQKIVLTKTSKQHYSTTKTPSKKLSKKQKRRLAIGGFGILFSILIALLVTVLGIALFIGLLILYLFFFPAW